MDSRLGYQSIPKPAPDPVSDQKPQGTWKTLLGFVVGIGVVLLAVIAGTDPPPSFLAER